VIIVPTLPPAWLTRQGDEDGYSKYEHVVVADLRKGKRLMTSAPLWDESIIFQTDSVGRPWRMFPTVSEVDWFFQRFTDACIRHPKAVTEGHLSLTIDVETTKDAPLLSQLINVGFGFRASDEEQVINVPILCRGGGRYWTESDEIYVRRLLQRQLARTDICTAFHNKSFDKAVLWAQGLPVLGWSWCSLASHHCWDGEMPHNLAFVSSLLTDARYWKDDGKGDAGNLAIPDFQFRLYNLRDVLVTQRIQPTLHLELIRLRQWPLYIEELRCAEIMCRASIRGMLIDEERRMSPVIDGTTGKAIGLGPAMVAQRDEAIKMLRDLSGDQHFEPSKPAQVQSLFFQKLGFPVVLKSLKTGAPKVDKEALMLLELLASTREQKIGLRGVIQFRQAEKTLGTFVTGLGKYIHPATWRFHTQWKLLAVSGRFTSSPNAQNWSKKIKRMFRSANGYKFVGVDLSQAELRYIAYLANDAALLRMYREGINVHTVNACLLFKIQCPDPDDLNPQTERYIREEMLRVHGLDYSNCAVVAKSNWKPIRTLAKNFVFGKNYGAQDETVFSILRSKRDPDTNKLLFPTLILSEIQALSVMWTKRLHPEIPRWWESIQMQTRKAGGYFCPISGRSRLYRGGYKQNEMLNCVDAETEALTRDRGWVRGFDLKHDDVLLTKNAVRGTLEWQPMTDLRLFPGRHVRTVEFRSRDFNAVSTLDHRWLVHDRRTGLDVCKTSAEIDPYGMDAVHRAGAMAGAGRADSLDVIELIGWFLTDASYAELPRKKTAPRPTVTIVQSAHANPEKVTRIDALIARLGLKVWRGRGNVAKRACETWQIDAEASAWLHSVFPARVLTPAFIASLSKAQAERLVEVMVLGDGSRDAEKTTFGCATQIKADMFQFLCVVAGFATSQRVRMPDGRQATSPKVGNIIVAKHPFWTVSIHRRDRSQVLASQRRESEGITSVWCPIVPNTYFVARREGQVFVTGNTPIQCGVASWMNKCMIEIQDTFDRETGGAAQIIQQVHDALNSEVPDEYTKRAGEVKMEVLNRHFPLLGHNAQLPADKADVNEYLDKV
jgi:DNA polymerase I-like protein with 3'-5' exonuclease and polymerase domains